MSTKPAVTLTHFARRIEDEEDYAQQKPLDLGIFRRIFTYTRPYSASVKWLIFCVLVRGLQGASATWLLSYIIKVPIVERDFTGLAWGVAGYTALVASTAFILFYRVRTAQRLGEDVVHDLRQEIFEHCQRMTMSVFTRVKIGRFISYITTDSNSVREGLQNAVFIAMVNAGQVVVAGAIMLYTDWVLFMVVLFMTPTYFVVYHHFRKRLTVAQRTAQESFSRITATIAESVTGIRVTQGFVREDRNAEIFAGLANDHSGYNMATSRASGVFSVSVEFLNSLIIGVLFMVGGYLIFSGTFHHAEKATAAAAIITFYLMANQMLDPVATMGNQYNVAVTSMAGAERIFKLLDRKPDFVDPPDAVPLPPLKGKVEFKHVHFEYEPGKPVLRDVSFSAEPGQTIALVGHTGSGKTSIINLISKFYLPQKGQILLDGHDITMIQTPSLNRQMGIVLQVNFLFTGTIMDNIRVAKPSATDKEIIDAARALDCVDMIDVLPEGFQTVVGERGAGLSLGQRQLICFTRAMLADPRILILDEATSSVDTMTESRVQKALSILLKGRTSFVVAHRLSTIRHADIVLVLDHGKIVERGNHSQLLATGGVYANLYRQFIRATQA